MSYLWFVDAGTSKSGKTRRWKVQNAQSGALLGQISWWGPWRRYVFFPVDGTVLFDADCLEEIATFIREKAGKPV